jgi:hypothetical protein
MGQNASREAASCAAVQELNKVQPFAGPYHSVLFVQDQLL